jgi:hypothetical protein
MTGSVRAAWLAVGLLAAVAGCQSRLNLDHTLDVDVGSSKDVVIDAPRYDQKVAVTVESDNPVSVYVCLLDNRKAVHDALDKGKKPEGVLASKEQVQTDTFDVTVPAKQQAVVLVEAGTKAAKVKLKIKGQ